MSTQNNDTTAGWILFGAVIVAVCAGVLWLLPQVWAYYSQVGGRGALLKAESTRQVRVLEAKAKLEASTLEAEAEVRRAEGSAKAIAAIKDELGGPEGYLRWLYIKNLEETDNKGVSERIYIPTDGLVPLPISEANRIGR